jgi:hypothetical protein
MRITTLLILFFTANYAFAQNDSLSNEEFLQELQQVKSYIQILQNNANTLKTEVSDLQFKLKALNDTIVILKQKIQENNNVISQTAERLGTQIAVSEQNASNRIQEIDLTLSKKSLYAILGVLLAVLFSGLIYWLLSKRQSNDKIELSDKLIIAKNEYEKEGARLDRQFLEIIEKQLKIADKLNSEIISVDHTFHKSSANELMRIINYANTLDPISQQAIALKGSIERLKNYFKASKYDIIDYSGLEFDERLNMEVKESIFDENIAKGKEVIIKTLKPEIKFNGEVIQRAQVITKYNN